MSDNRFSGCAHLSGVISTIAYIADREGREAVTTDVITAALARIAELTQPTVTAEARAKFDDTWRELYTRDWLQ